MRANRNHSWALLCISLAATSVFAQAPWQIDAPGRVVAVADIHGANDAFVRILERSAVIDADLQWIGGTTHLVIVGDVLDRGPDSRAALDLIMRLKPEAQAQGGDVHLVLGNHEIMNIVGDLRYVSAGEYAAFADEEPTEIRAAALERFLAAASEDANNGEAARAEFDRQYPLGFFAHRAAFSSNGTYGAWLLDQPMLLLVNDSAFAHGGVSRAFGAEGGESINAELRQQLRDYVAAMEQLIEVGVLSQTDDFYDHPTIIEAIEEQIALGEASWPDGAQQAAEQVKDLNYAPVFALSSPIWYRGMVSCSPLVGRDHWLETLNQLAAERIVVGHTPTPEALVLSRMDDGILRVDTGMLESYYGGRASALIIENGVLEAMYENEPARSAPTIQPRRVGNRPADLTDAELESLLANAEIVSRTTPVEAEDAAGTVARTRLTLRRGDVEVNADFYPANRANSHPEVAAYRLDELLGLDMVPVTVARDLDGEPGALQYVPANYVTEPQRRAANAGGSAWCPLREQFPAMYIFDILIYNEGRTPEQIAYSAEDFNLLLLGHERSFGTQRGRPAHLREVMLDLGPAWREALQALDEDRLTEALSETLSRRQIRALARRVETVLEEAGGQ